MQMYLRIHSKNTRKELLLWDIRLRTSKETLLCYTTHMTDTRVRAVLRSIFIVDKSYFW